MHPSVQANKYYEILGVNRATPLSQIREAHKRLIREWHPDRFDLDDPLRKEAELRAMEINQAFQFLKKIRSSGLGYTKVRPRSKPKREQKLTVESKIEIRDGKVFKIKRKRKVKVQPSPESVKEVRRSSSAGKRRSSSRSTGRGTRKAGMNQVLESAKAFGQALAKAAQTEPRPTRHFNVDDLVIHIVEGRKSIRAA